LHDRYSVARRRQLLLKRCERNIPKSRQIVPRATNSRITGGAISGVDLDVAAGDITGVVGIGSGGTGTSS
jgi:hypothetical protein